MHFLQFNNMYFSISFSHESHGIYANISLWNADV